MSWTTSLLRAYFGRRIREIEQYSGRADLLQREQLKRILKRAEGSEFARRYGLRASLCPTEFAERVPVSSYEELKGDIERLYNGAKDVLFRGGCSWFAKSSGTTSDKSKFIPVPHEHLRDCHYRGGRDTLALYLRNRPDSKFASTKGLVLGGSFAPIGLSQTAQAGDLSSILVKNMPLLGDLFRTPSRKTLLMDEWNAKMAAIVREVSGQRVGSLSGVPSWMLVLLKEVLKYTGKKDITEVWPDLEVFFHGGISFSPYRETYRSLISSPRMQYMETYNASEGFFAIQDDPTDPAMLLMLDYGVYYEFVPLEALDESQSPVTGHLDPLPLEEVELGVPYAMLITTLGGLYRYLIGDTVRFTSRDPYKIVISGRTKQFINAFGEELMVSNAERAIEETSRLMNCSVRDYTAAPWFSPDGLGRGRHEWLIEFIEPPADLDAFARELDLALQRLNSDYEAKRYSDMTLLPLKMHAVPVGFFSRWLAEKGKLGGQHKVPRLSNNRQYIEDMLRLL